MFFSYHDLESSTEGKKALEKMAEEYIAEKNEKQKGNYAS